jgi:hypothetical protein
VFFFLRIPFESILWVALSIARNWRWRIFTLQSAQIDLHSSLCWNSMVIVFFRVCVSICCVIRIGISAPGH